MSDEIDFLRLIGVRKTSDPWVFESVSLPGRAGNQQPIPYGGCAVATAVNAAGQTIKPEPRMVPYSLMGHFLGPASLDSHFVCEVRPVRDTRSFTTRYVTVKQSIKGTMRPILALTLDMIASPLSTREHLDQAKATGSDPGGVQSLLRYQPSATTHLDRVQTLETPQQNLKRRMASGELNEFHEMAYNEFMGLWYKIFDARIVPESIMTQNMLGLNPSKTTQDELAVTDRTVYDWFKIRRELPSAHGTNTHTPGGPDGQLPQTTGMAHLCTLAFALDAALAFAPISISNGSIMDASAASTLDFAQRYHSDALDANQWLLREVKTVAGGWQRTYSQAHVFNQDGELLATCNQQCVLRPTKEALEKKSKL